MIIEKDSQKVQTIGLNSTSGFKINATAKAFAILSSGLYANKIRAIVRELSCNAYDSHKAANKEHVPFKVVLPSPLDSTFSVQDFGLGLSEEQVFNLYTTYFESTKTQSNDYIGALGLGSKSPFSYTSSFLVTSIFEGVKSTYLAYLADEGFPSISKVSSEESGEENGVTISFNVKSADFEKFQEEAKFVFSTFPVQPNLVGYKYSIENIPVIYSDNKIFSSVIKNRMNVGGGIRVVQGNIAYPFSFDSFDATQFTKKFAKEISLEQVQELFKKLQGFSLDICVPIGTCDIAASRESLSYDKETVTNLAKHIIDFVTTIYDRIISEVSKETTLVSQCRKYGEVIDLLQNDLRIKEGWGFKTIHSLIFTLVKGKLDLGLGDILATSSSDKFNASVSHQFPTAVSGTQIYTWTVYDILNDKATKRSKALEYCGRLHDINPGARGKIVYNLNTKMKFVKCDSRDWRATLKYLAATDKSFDGCRVFAFFNPNDIELGWKQYDDFLAKIDVTKDVIKTSSIELPKAIRAKTEKTDFTLSARMLDHSSCIFDYFSLGGKKNKTLKTKFTSELIFDNYVKAKSDANKRFYLIAGKNSAKQTVYTTYKNFDGEFINSEINSNHNISDIISKINLQNTVVAVVCEKYVDVLKKKGFTCFWDMCNQHIVKIYDNTRHQAIIVNAIKKAMNDHPDGQMINSIKGAVTGEWRNNINDVNVKLRAIFQGVDGLSKYLGDFHNYMDKIKLAVTKTDNRNVNNIVLNHPMMSNIIKAKYSRDNLLSDRLAKKYTKIIDTAIERYGIIWCMSPSMLNTEFSQEYIKKVFKEIGV